MKCDYCEKVFDDDDNLVLNYFDHIQRYHYDVLSDTEKIMHDIRKKMIKSKTDYQVDKNIKGDSDLIFNAKNSDT